MSNPNKTSTNSGSFTGCLFPVLLGGLLMFILLLVAVRSSEAESRQIASLPEPPTPSVAFPADVPTVYEVLAGGDNIFFNGTVEADQPAYIVTGDGKTLVTVEFKPISSVKHLWSGSNAEFLITAPYQRSLEGGTHTDTWDDLLLYELDPFTPSMVVVLSVEPEFIHSWIDVTASMDVTYPASANGAFFENRNKHLERGFRLFVVTEKDVQLQVAHDQWVQAAGRNSEKPSVLYTWFWPILIATVGLIVGISVVWTRLGGN